MLPLRPPRGGEGFSRRMARLPAGHLFPARDRRIDIKRVDLDAVAAAARALRGKDRRAAAAKGINNDVVLLCNVEQGVRDERDRGQGGSAGRSRTWRPSPSGPSSDPPCCSWPIVTNMAEYATVSGIAGG